MSRRHSDLKGLLELVALVRALLANWDSWHLDLKKKMDRPLEEF